ncbi:isoaspartyl peptidase/L-asparaginase-like [Harmonia axyridis]|uniref:isoaspartyl peptidase/L-asparaginase-like n=1 Tax=Harmonia axyridis TaxID=115357 RepID=UPI001E277BC2|nr:isoaspartyl peptidase/L-asparaginase-like [Harmonia axyridis]
MEPILIVHGGAGDIKDSRVPDKIKGVKIAAKAGYKILKNGGTALDAVETAVRILEDDESMNAGRGSVLNLDGEVEMDASIMDGSTLAAGAVTIVRDIAHPISLARLVMERTPHVLLAGPGANKFAEEQGIPRLLPGSLITPFAKEALKEFKKKGGSLTEIGGKDNPGDVGTVGAVALDSQGHLAAATSTGGINGKMVGRSSDTSLIGSGTYADDEIGGVSTTGHGDSIIKVCMAYAILKNIENGSDPQKATQSVLDKMSAKLNNTAGAITISKTGEIGVGFSSKRMSWAYQKADTIYFGIEQEEVQSEKVIDE